jgi:hypothetical protein
MKKNKYESRFFCTKCGLEFPFDKEKSNTNWKVYKDTCICGCKKGNFRLIENK